MINVRELFGETDIYLLDQILKDRFSFNASILDAGCGGGRNLVYFLRNGNEVFGVDQSPEAIKCTRMLAKDISPNLPAANFQVASIEQLPFDSNRFDAVICSAVLHFARDESHFELMLAELWRVLKGGGLFFARFASSIGIEEKLELIKDRRYLLPDGSERFLVDQDLLAATTARIGGIWLEPIKTTNVQNLRSMTTWVLRKSFI